MMTNSQSPRAVAVQGFLAQFATLGQDGVGLALRALSEDEIFVREAEQLLEFDARLVLLKRLSLAHSVSEDLSVALDAAIAQARKLAVFRNDVIAAATENALVKHLHTTRQIASYTRQATDLTTFMAQFAERLRGDR